MTAEGAARLCARGYASLARAFPEEFRAAHGAEVTSLSEELIHDAARRGGWSGLISLAIRVFVDLAARILAEQSSALARDTRDAIRSLIKSPGYTAISVLSIGLGISLVTTVYCEIRSTVTSPLPGVADPSSLVTVLQPVSYPAYEEFRDASGQFESLAAFEGPVPFILRTAGGRERVWGQIVSPNYFQVLGVRCSIGRAFAPDGDNTAALAVMSDRLWRRHFAGDARMVGQTVEIGGRTVTVIGIGSPGFLGASPMTSAADLWFASTADQRIAPELARQRFSNPRLRAFFVAGRLAANVSVERAEAALDAIVRRQAAQIGERVQKGRLVSLAPGGRYFPIRDQDLPLVLAFPVLLVGITLWIACTNVATMSLARTVARRRDTAIRLALGAGRVRVVRRMLTESLMISVAAAVLGLGLAHIALGSADAIRPMMPGYMTFEFHMDWTALLVTMAAAVAAGVLFGLVPALRAARTEIAPGLGAGPEVLVAGHRWFGIRNLLVLQQVAGSLALLLLVGFIILGFQRATSLELGFEANGLYLASLDPERQGYSGPEAADLLDRIERRLAETPGIRTVAYSRGRVIGALGEAAQTKSRMIRNPEMVRALEVEHVGPTYFEVLGVPVSGRSFTTVEARNGARVAVINQTLANTYGAGAAAIGSRVEIDGDRYEIVGIVRDLRGMAIMRLSQGRVYVPFHPAAPDTAAGSVVLSVRAGPGTDVPGAIRRVAASLDRDLAVFDTRSMTDQVREGLYIVRMSTFVYGGIGLFGLILAAIGLGGVTAYAVVQRRKEIGIRVALGARARDVLGLVMREGAGLVAAGTVLGLAFALAAARTLGGFVELLSEALRTSLSDPVLLVGAPLLLAFIALLACYLPAQRSRRVDPVAVLREG